MSAEKLQNATQILSFPGPVGLIESKQEDKMKYLNYTIEPRPDNTFYIDARIERGGKSYRKRKTVIGKQTAIRAGREMVKQLEEKAVATSSKVIFENMGECFDFYLKHTPNNVENMAWHMSVVQGHLADTKLSDLQSGYDNFITHMRTSYTIRGNLYSGSTLNKFTRRITASLNFCIKKGKISRETKIKTTLFKQERRSRIISDQEFQALLKVMEEHNPHLIPIFTFAMQIPSRRAELVNMKKEWVDLDRKVVVIPKEFLKNDKHDCVKPIPANMLEYFSSIPREAEYVFYRYVKSKDEYLPIGDFKRAWNTCKRLANIQNLRWHDNRHNAASKLVLMKVSEREIMQVANWSTNMLSTYYNNSGIDAAKTVFDALSKE